MVVSAFHTFLSWNGDALESMHKIVGRSFALVATHFVRLGPSGAPVFSCKLGSLHSFHRLAWPPNRGESPCIPQCQNGSLRAY
eukprot:1188456-Prorocentrum_minimum.AAC.1